MKPPSILISGAGIAGVALARCLAQRGIAYTLIEKQVSPHHGGTGIALPFNAIQALRELGLAEQVLNIAHQVHEIIYTNKNAAVLSRADLHSPPLNQDKFVALLRSQLYEILLDGIKPNIHFATTIDAIEPQADGVKVKCSNPVFTGVYDVVVAAEGIHSKLRQHCFPDERTIIDHHMPNWRFVVQYPHHDMQPVYMFARTEMFMAYPLTPDSLYCYAHVYDATRRYESGSSKQHLHDLFGGFGGEVNNILDRVAEQPVVRGRLQSVSKPYYVKGRIVFVGDASNACSPLLQQGAALAFEDGLCLADQLHEYPVDQAIKEYHRVRAPRVDWIVKTSDAPIKLMKLMRYPLVAIIRNQMIRMTGPLNADGWKQLAKQSWHTGVA